MDTRAPHDAQNRPGTFTPEQADILLQADRQNILKKLKEGRTLSPSERNELQAIRDGRKPDLQAFARSQNDLAKILGVSRWMIQRAMKLDGHPESRADGRLDIAAWRAFLQAAGSIEDEDATELRAENLRLQNRHLELRIGVMNRAYRPVAEIERWGAELGAAIRKIVTQIHLAAPSVVGVSVAEAEARLREVEDELIEQLHTLNSVVPDQPEPVE